MIILYFDYFVNSKYLFTCLIAQAYLKYGAVSLKQLVEQLEYEDFSHEDARYGAEHSGADWNLQASKSAQVYLEYTQPSRDELITQLEYEGFTHEQAVFAAEHNDLVE